jgi:VWFA-related protein
MPPSTAKNTTPANPAERAAVYLAKIPELSVASAPRARRRFPGRNALRLHLFNPRHRIEKIGDGHRYSERPLQRSNHVSTRHVENAGTHMSTHPGFAFAISILALALPAGTEGVQSPSADAPVVLDHPLRFDVNLVQVDAVVADRAGHRPTDLKAEDFEVRQDGKPQAITHFLFVPARPPATESAALPRAGQLQRTELRRTFLLFVDDVRISFADFSLMRKALLHFVDEQLQPGDLCALYRTSGGPGAARVFSADLAEIRDGVERMHWLHPMPSMLQPNQFLKEFQSAVHALGALPGRKSIVLVNGGFDPRREDVGLEPGLQSVIGIRFSSEMIRHLADEANRASVVVYAIDARGLPVGAGMEGVWFDASERGVSAQAQQSQMLEMGSMGARQMLDQRLRYFRSWELPASLALSTGGLFLHENNDLGADLGKVESDNAGYYLLAWNPGEAAFVWKGGPEYHKIRVKVRRAGLTVRTREGFFGVPEGGQPSPSTKAQMAEALFSPFSGGDIDVDLVASFQHDEAAGSRVDALIHVRPRGIAFEEDKPGCQAAKLEVLTTARPLQQAPDEKGHINSQIATVEACGATAERVLRDGIVYRIPTAVSWPGPYEMRVAVRNLAPGEEAPSIGAAGLIKRPPGLKPKVAIGAASEFVEVPDLKKTELALSGVSVRLEGSRSDESQTWSPAQSGDPAVREFHPGDAIHYRARLFGTMKGQELTGELAMVREGAEVFHQSVPVKDDTVEGMYRTGPDIAAGQYVLRVTVAEGAGKKARSATEWSTFSIVRQ